MKIKTGCSGFPVKKREYYRDLDLVEVSAGSRNILSTVIARQWRKNAPEGFEFTVKAVLPADGKIPGQVRKVPMPGDKATGAWKKTLEVAAALSARVIVFETSLSFGPAPENKESLKKIAEYLKRPGHEVAWDPGNAWPEEDIREICEVSGLAICSDPFTANTRAGRIRYFRLGSAGSPHKRYTGMDLKRLKDLCEDELSKVEGDGIYVVFNNEKRMADALRFEWMVRNTGRIKDINLSFLRCLCDEIELEEEDEKVRRLSIEAERIIMLIFHTEYAQVDIEIEKSKLRQLCKELFPGKEFLYEMIYARRFDRLWEQFRGRGEDL